MLPMFPEKSLCYAKSNNESHRAYGENGIRGTTYKNFVTHQYTKTKETECKQQCSFTHPKWFKKYINTAINRAPDLE